MRIVVVNTQAPFVSGGAEDHARRLCEELKSAGHQSELVTIPFNWVSAEGILDHAIAAASIDLAAFFGEPVDMMIGLRFPAYLMQHPNKRIWLIHQYREAYDLWEKNRSSLRTSPKGNLVRQIISDMDRKAFSDARILYTNSKNVSERLRKFNGINADPLYHPPPLATRLRSGSLGDYFYFPSRISGLKRQRLALEALARCKSPIRIVFTGGADSEIEAAGFRQAVEELKLGDQVEWRGSVSEADLVDLYANARGVVFPPFDEDLGYVTLEAMISGKAVITTTDSGGPLEFISNGSSGLVVKPDAQSLAQALERLWSDPAQAARFGAQARMEYDRLGMSWGNVIRKLTDTDAP